VINFAVLIGLTIVIEPPVTITGKVVAIADGDTLTVLDDAKVQHKIRLAGIDAPEKKQAFGSRARQSLGDKVFGQVVRVDVTDVDRYRREVGRIFLGDHFINLEMGRDGFAWRNVRYDKAGEFTDAERGAREKRRGLWADPNPVPPWEYRREKLRTAKGLP
jgi:endonuclease YncB( thermonuclease family)